MLRLKDSAGNYNIVVNAPLFPAVDAPTYLINGTSQSGGLIAAGSQLRMTSNVPTVYYTLDGTDPRLVGDGINPSAIAYNAGATNTTHIASGTAWKYRDNGIDLGQTWRQPSFDDSAWSSGNSQLGYGDGDEATVVSFGGNANNKHITTYFRKTINVAAGAYVGATLRLKRDDGVIVYLNGTEVVRDNLPSGVVSFSTTALGHASDDGNDWQLFTINPGLLQAGNNTIAVEIHQAFANSSDISFDRN